MCFFWALLSYRYSNSVCILHGWSPRVYYTAWLTGCGKGGVRDRWSECSDEWYGYVIYTIISSSSTVNYIAGFPFLCLVQRAELFSLALLVMPLDTDGKLYKEVAAIKPNNGSMNKLFDISFQACYIFFHFLWFFSCLLHFCFFDCFIVAVPMRECLGRHSCMSSTSSVYIPNNFCFLLSPGYYFILEWEFYWTKYKINHNNTNNNCFNEVMKAMRNQDKW